MRNKIELVEDNRPMVYQRSVWFQMSPSERLRRSWSMRRLLKDKRAVHDKKIFPTPYSQEYKISTY